MFVLTGEVVPKIGEHFAHVVVFFCTYGETSYPVVVVVRYYFVRFYWVAHVIFVEYYYLLLLGSFHNQVELGVSTAVGYPGVPDFQEDVDFVGAFLDDSEGFAHVSWEPIDVILESCDNLHVII